MEARNIIIVDSANQVKTTVTTDATTFGELKNAVVAAGINISGKDWLEGITKTTPMADDSLLPTNVSYKGQTTNNLVYLLTNTNKNISSGATRAEMYVDFKNHPEMAQAFKESTGKNFTNGSNVELAEFIASWDTETEEPICESCEKYDSLVYGVACLLTSLGGNVLNDIDAAVKEIHSRIEGVDTVDFTDSDIEEMFN